MTQYGTDTQIFQVNLVFLKKVYIFAQNKLTFFEKRLFIYRR